VTFGYSVTLYGTDETSPDMAFPIAGTFAADLKTNIVQITASSSIDGATNVTVALGPEKLAVQVMEPDGKTSCLTLPVKDSEESEERVGPPIGLFSGVEEVNESECDRFSYAGTGPHQENLEFWFSPEEKKVCRLLVQTSGLTGDGEESSSALFDVPEWTMHFNPPGGEAQWTEGKDGDVGPEGWQCKSATESQNSWLSLASQAPKASLPTASALAKLSEASGAVGLVPEKLANILSRIIVTSPSQAGKTPAGAGSGNADCADFSGSWSTSIGSAIAVIQQAGCTLTITGLSGDSSRSATSGTAKGDIISTKSPDASGTLDGNAIVWTAGYAWTRNTDDSGSSAEVTTSVLSEDLQTFSFSFQSAYPLAGDKGLQQGEDGGMSYSPTSDIGETRRSSHGELKVDLAQRLLYLSSKAADVSTGIPRVLSKIILRGDQAKLYARTKLEPEEYDQCWMVNTTQLPLPLGKRQPNPFQYSDHAGDCKSLPTGGGMNCKERRVSWLDDSKRLEFFIDDVGRLLGMVLDDVQLDVAAGITIRDFSTQPLSPEWFEPTADWKCKDLKYLPDVDRIVEWDLIRAFFPIEAPVPAVDDKAAQDDARRLFAV